MLGLCEPGDEVILFEPFYDAYPAQVAMAGAERRVVTLRAPDFALEPEALRAAVTSRTRLLLLNSPHNPTGRVLTREELETVATVCLEHDLIAICDEVYEHLTYDGAEHIPLATLPGMAERTLTISSLGKTFSVTGWKTGWLSGPPALVEAATRAKQFLTYAGGTPFQHAAAHALEHEGAAIRAVKDALEAKRDRLCDGLETAGFRLLPRPAGGYFATADVEEDGAAFCWALPERAGVVAVPSSAFYDDAEAGRTLVRFAFCKRDELLDEAVARLLAAPARARER
jgi:N-succinyldiaminopimelate aminotransferase